jgi:hypothetical protein
MRRKARHESGEKGGGTNVVASQDPIRNKQGDLRKRNEGTCSQMYPLRSLHRSPPAAVAELPSDPVAPAAECARLRPMTTLPSSSSSETRTSARAGVAVVTVVVVVLAGMTKYRPIAWRTAAFAAPPMPPPSSAPGGETAIRWLGIGDCLLYYTPHRKKIIQFKGSSDAGMREREKREGEGEGG